MEEQAVLTIRNKSENLYLRLSDILYIQSDGNYCNICFADGGTLNTLSYRRAEIARMIQERTPDEWKRKFKILGRFYIVNTDYVLRIQPNMQKLTFRVNKLNSDKRITIKATAQALNDLIIEMERS